MKEARTEETNINRSATYDQTNTKAPGWLKVGALAAASALAGGLAAAWFYRKTLARLRQAEAEQATAEPFINRDDADGDI